MGSDTLIFGGFGFRLTKTSIFGALDKVTGLSTFETQYRAYLKNETGKRSKRLGLTFTPSHSFFLLLTFLQRHLDARKGDLEEATDSLEKAKRFVRKLNRVPKIRLFFDDTHIYVFLSSSTWEIDSGYSEDNVETFSLPKKEEVATLELLGEKCKMLVITFGGD
jgi:hypothetical protein